MAIPKPLVLIILDGWGYAPPSPANAISLARKPNYDRLIAEFPNTLIHTSGRYVGLPTGQMGNSEVGHLNIGAGRVVYMDITKIDVTIENGEFFSNPALLKAMEAARIGERRLHLFGLAFGLLSSLSFFGYPKPFCVPRLILRRDYAGVREISAWTFQIRSRLRVLRAYRDSWQIGRGRSVRRTRRQTFLQNQIHGAINRDTHGSLLLIDPGIGIDIILLRDAVILKLHVRCRLQSRSRGQLAYIRKR